MIILSLSSVSVVFLGFLFLLWVLLLLFFVFKVFPLKKPCCTRLLWWTKAINIVVEHVSRHRTAFSRTCSRRRGVSFRIWRSMTTAFVFRSFEYPLKKCICFAYHSMLSGCRNSTTNSFLRIRTNAFSSNAFKEKRPASSLFFQEEFVWQLPEKVTLLLQYIEDNKGGGVWKNPLFSAFLYAKWFSNMT